MSAPLRSKQGCWTCRLRKKKCDEIRPRCTICASLAITCYGFGPKPDWMHDAGQRRAIIQGFRETVKHTSRRKAPVAIAPPGNRAIKPAPQPPNAISTTPLVSHRQRQHQDDDDDDDNLISPQPPSHENDSNSSQPISPHPPPEKDSIPIPTGEESMLLMHFLDKVFPLEYPIYNPPISEGGRGWLLSVLLNTKQLYHAALTLSAYHQRAVGAETMSHPSQTASLNRQESHLSACMKMIHQNAEPGCPGNKIGIVAAIVQLLFFTLFSSSDDMWKAHLDVLVKLSYQHYEKELEDVGLPETARADILEGRHPSENGPKEMELVVTFRFLGSTILWLDIISSITMGVTPHLLPYHSSILGPNSQMRLEKIMGCQNSVMVQIGRIAALYAQKDQSLQHGAFNSAQFERVTRDLSLDCLTLETLECLGISGGNATVALDSNSDPSVLVTFMFTRMIPVYLHLVAQDFQNLEALHSHVSMVIQILQKGVSSEVLRAIICPVYVIGTVAGLGDQQFFRDLLSSPPLLDPSMQHRQKILPALEQIWSRRYQAPGITWKDCIHLTSDILLV